MSNSPTDYDDPILCNRCNLRQSMLIYPQLYMKYNPSGTGDLYYFQCPMCYPDLPCFKDMQSSSEKNDQEMNEI